MMLRFVMRSPNIVCPRPKAVKAVRGPVQLALRVSSISVTVITAQSGLLDHLNSDGFDYRSNRLLHFPRSFPRWRGFGLGLGNRSLRRFRSLGYLACLTAFS